MLNTNNSSSLSTDSSAHNPDESIVTVGTFDSIVEADLVHEELTAAGIEAWVSGATAAQTFITMPETGLGIQVAAHDEQRARVIVAEALSSAMRVSDSELEAAATGTPTQSDDAESGG